MKTAEEIKNLLDKRTPGKWQITNNPGDWGLTGSVVIHPEGGNPYDYNHVIAYVEYTTPYCLGANKKEREAADRAKIDAELMALAPILAQKVLAAEKLVDALCFYQENTKLCRLIHSEGNEGRNALANDGGNIALNALKEWDLI